MGRKKLCSGASWKEGCVKVRYYSAYTSFYNAHTTTRFDCHVISLLVVTSRSWDAGKQWARFSAGVAHRAKLERDEGRSDNALKKARNARIKRQPGEI